MKARSTQLDCASEVSLKQYENDGLRLQTFNRYSWGIRLRCYRILSFKDDLKSKSTPPDGKIKALNNSF